jgi:type IV fimbrial biogenesis protein FimT
MQHPEHPSTQSASLSTRRARGFTLLELLVTLAVATILVTVAVPSFRSFVQNSRATTHTNELVTALNLGRSEAIRRGRPVTVCSSSDGATCSGATDWSDGWVVLAPGNAVVRTWDEREGGAGVVTAEVDRIDFEPRGSAGAGGTFEIRLPGCSGDLGRDVDVNVAGRVSTTRVTC